MPFAPPVAIKKMKRTRAGVTDFRTAMIAWLTQQVEMIAPNDAIAEMAAVEAQLTPDVSIATWNLLAVQPSIIRRAAAERWKGVDGVVRDAIKNYDADVAESKEDIIADEIRRVAAELSEAQAGAAFPAGPSSWDGRIVAAPPVATDVVSARAAYERKQITAFLARERRTFVADVNRVAATARSNFNVKLGEAERRVEELLRGVKAARAAEFAEDTRRVKEAQLKRHVGRVTGAVHAAGLPPRVTAVLVRGLHHLSNPTTFSYFLMCILAIIATAVVGGAVMFFQSNEIARALIDSNEYPGVRLARGAAVVNARVAPVDLSYRAHYAAILGRAEPPPPFTPDELERGFFEVAWSRGRTVNVTGVDLEAWLAGVPGECACAQDVGVDRRVVRIGKTVMYDPVVASRSDDAVRARLTDAVRPGRSHVYDVPRVALVEYTSGPTRARAAARLTAVEAVACVVRCADLARARIE